MKPHLQEKRNKKLMNHYKRYGDAQRSSNALTARKTIISRSVSLTCTLIGQRWIEKNDRAKRVQGGV